MNEIHLHRIDLNLLVTFEALMDTRSVTVAAERLGKTPSAVSHALARLREQLDDPLLVRVGGKMQPSPFALRLVGDVRPILKSIQRAVSPPAPFDPATSTRVFRLAAPTWPTLTSRIFGRISTEAPGASLIWQSPTRAALDGIAEGTVDLAMLGENTPSQEGVTKRMMPLVRVRTFARAGHPAIAEWSLSEWLRWPHLMVTLGTAERNTLDTALDAEGLTRRIGARVPDFGTLGPLLSRTNFLLNGFGMAMLDLLDPYDLCVLELPWKPIDGGVSMFWNTRLERDPETEWFRTLVTSCYDGLFQKAEADMARREIRAAQGR